MDLYLLERLAKAIAEEFGNKMEVIVHDLTRNDAEHTIAVIENGEVSQRHAGDGASAIVLEALQRKHDPTLSDKLGYLTRTKDGRILKSSTVYIRNEDNEIEGVFSLNYDITEMLMAKRAIDSLLSQKAEARAPERIPSSITDLLDDLIEHSVALIGKPVAMMNKEDKIRAIHFLNDAGAFLVTKSGDKVSKYFGISKYTLYSYIDAKEQERGE